MAKAVFKRRIGAQVILAVERELTMVDVHAAAISSTDVGAEGWEACEGGVVVNVGPLVLMLRGGEVVIADAVDAVFG